MHSANQRSLRQACLGEAAPGLAACADIRQASRARRAAQILNQFGDLPPETLELQRYAAWKAADINKALREGRTPAAGASITASDAAELADLVGDMPSARASAGGCPAQRCRDSRCLSGG